MHIDKERIKQDKICTAINNCDILEIRTLLNNNNIKDYKR